MCGYKNIGGGKYLSPDNPAYNNRLFGLVYFVCIIHDAKLVSLASLVFENDRVDSLTETPVVKLKLLRAEVRV